MEGKIKGLWKKASPKTKIIIISAIAGLLFNVIFIVVLISPLMALGIIDIEGISNVSYNNIMGSTHSTSINTYWWPVGSSETNEGVDANDPNSINVIKYFDNNESSPSYHIGVDIDSNGADPGVVNVVAVRAGEVVYPTSISDVQFDDNGDESNTDGSGYGNYVKIKHSDGSYTLYAHLAKNSINVTAGEVVSQGQVIGKIGSSGNATGTYLHFEIRLGSDSQISAVDPLKYIDVNDTRPNTYGNSDAFSITTTSLTRNEFISKMNDYCNRSGNEHFCNTFSSDAGLVYDTSIKNNVNPELVVVTAGSEQGWYTSCDNNNYWGINVTNLDGGCGTSYASLADGIAGYGKLLNSYTSEHADSINNRNLERENANCDPAGHGKAGTLVGMQSIYSWIGDYRYNPGDWSLGGCVYLNIIYGENYCSSMPTCLNKNNCPAESATTVCEQNDYTAFQVEQKMKMRYDIFGL